jgi:hypothetical protein
MTIRNLRTSFVLLALFVFAGTAAAQGPVINASTTSSNLAMAATVQTAVQLNISTGTSGATVAGSNSTGLFTLDFGNVNGLGLGTPTTNVSVTADATGATYTTPINLTPIYSGFATETADVTVQAGASANQTMAREGAAAVSVTAVTTAVAAFSDAASGSNNERFVGFRVLRTDVAGAKAATLIYTITVAI